MISVIIPFYNSEKYLSRCIESILAQSFKEYEVILIDDGSTDSSIKSIERIIAEDSRFHLYTKANGGASSARNIGIQQACGDYIVFVDSDDYVYPELLYDLWTEIETFKVDLVIQSREQVHGGKTFKYLLSNEKFAIPEEIQYLFEKNNIASFCVPHSKIFRKSIIEYNHILFDEKLTIGEDFDFLLKYLSSVHSVYTSSLIRYRYIERNGSLSSNLNRIDVEFKNLLIMRESVSHFLELYPYESVRFQCEKIRNVLVNRCIWSLSRNKGRNSMAILRAISDEERDIYHRIDHPSSCLSTIVHNLFYRKRIELLCFIMFIIRMKNNAWHA